MSSPFSFSFSPSGEERGQTEKKRRKENERKGGFGTSLERGM